MRKIYHYLIIVILFSSCYESQRDSTERKIKKSIKNKVVKHKFQSIIDSANVEGAILIYDLQKDIYYSNNFEWANKKNLPASTFKIANSIIALESGVVKNDSTLFKWDGEERGNKNWEQDLTFKEAFHFSCVPCYQDIARKIGAAKMQEYLEKFNYGNMDVDSKNIDVFWLEGNSRINQIQQISFLKKFYQSELSISERTEKIMKRLIIIEQNQDYILSGKTGLSVRKGKYNGWFIGYVETENKVYFFATNIEPKEQFNFDSFIMTRKNVTSKALQQLNILK